MEGHAAASPVVASSATSKALFTDEKAIVNEIEEIKIGEGTSRKGGNGMLIRDPRLRLGVLVVARPEPWV